MNRRATFLPIAMVAIISVLALIAIASGRSDAPDVVADSRYPYHICTFSKYCAGPACTDSNLSFVTYLEHEDGKPRIELAGVNPIATMTRIPDGLQFDTQGGAIDGTLIIFSNRDLNWVGSSGEAEEEINHFASGSCERLKTP